MRANVRHSLLRLGTALSATVLGTLPSTASADPGELTPIAINTQGNNFGYIEYLPEAYNEGEDWPVLIFLTGIGENGTGQLPATNDCRNGPNYNDPVLCRNLRHGPQNLIYQQQTFGTPLWNDETRPFIVISPQNPAPLFTYVPYSSNNLDAFVDYLIDQYAVDERRIYLTGMSMGGYSATLLANYNPDRFAAIAIMPGINGVPADRVCDLTQQNIWAFHGQNDGNPFNPIGIVDLITQFDACPSPHPNARLTIYTGAGHDVWTRTFRPASGMANATLTTYNLRGVNVPLDPYNVDLYTWLLTHDKPLVSAGPDLEGVTGEVIELSAVADDDDTFTTTWTQTSGPAVAISNASGLVASFEPSAAGVYEFRIELVDADGQWDDDTLLVTIGEGTGGEDTGGEDTGGGAESDGSESSTGGASDSSGGESTGLEDSTSGGESSSGAASPDESSSGAGAPDESSSGAGSPGESSSGESDDGGSDDGGSIDPLDALDDDFSSDSLGTWSTHNPAAAPATISNGQLVLQPGPNTAWFNTAQAAQYYRTVDGDFSVVADVTVASLAGGTPTPNWRLAGLMMRNATAPSSNTFHGALGTVGAWMTTNVVYEYQNTVNGASQYGYLPSAVGTSAQVRLCRVGSTVRTMFRADVSSPWILGDERVRADFGTSLAVGPVAFQLMTPADLRATFDNINFTTIDSLDDCAPGTINDVSSSGVSAFAAGGAQTQSLLSDEDLAAAAQSEGCACQASERPGTGAFWMLLPLGLLGLRRRRG